MYYRIAEKLAEEPRGAQNGWQGLAAVLRPEELATAGLPRGVAEQAAEKLAECRGCRLTVEPDCIQGELHIPAKGKHKPRNLLFAWWEDSLLFVDRGETAAECLETVRRMRPHHADAADDLLMDFFRLPNLHFYFLLFHPMQLFFLQQSFKFCRYLVYSARS